MSIKALIVDLDGTVYLEGKPIKNVIDLLNHHQANGIYMQFLTNNTSVSKQRYVSKLRALTLDFVEPEHIVTPVDSFLNFADEHSLRSCYYLLPQEVINYIEAQGGPPPDSDNPEMVIVGYDKELTYQKLRRACEFINDGIAYALTHIDVACPTERGPVPDCGSIANLIEATTGKDWKFHFGKPSEKLGDIIAKTLQKRNIRNEETVLIGDRFHTDIALGNMIGVSTCHVQTGEVNHLHEGDPEIFRPTFEYEDLCSFLNDRL